MVAAMAAMAAIAAVVADIVALVAVAALVDTQAMEATQTILQGRMVHPVVQAPVVVVVAVAGPT
jgi:hypothetical protein